MKKFLEKILLVSCLLGIGGTISPISSPPAFASMGSTGGGDSGGAGGGGYGGGGNISDTTSDHTSNNSENSSQNDLEHLIWILFVALLLFDSAWGDLFLWLKTKREIKKDYHSLFLSNCSFKEAMNRSKLFKQNQTIQEFKENLYHNGFKLKPADSSHQYPEALAAYEKAQYLYSQLLEERYANPAYSSKKLAQYLGRSFYSNMVKEINRKIKQGEVDDTVVSQADVAWYCELDNQLFVALINCKGQDKEVQFNQDFSDSFTRTEWSDYVLFGKTPTGQIKIVNLIYGEHFHLNGVDFNHQQGISGPYKERKL